MRRRWDCEAGDVIASINGQRVANPQTDYYLLDRAIQSSFGKPVELTIKSMNGTLRTASAVPEILLPFGDSPVSFLGMSRAPAWIWSSLIRWPTRSFSLGT